MNRHQVRRFWTAAVLCRFRAGSEGTQKRQRTAAVQNATRDGDAVSRFRGAKREFVPGILAGLGTFATVVDLGLRSSDSLQPRLSHCGPSALVHRRAHPKGEP